MCISFDLCKKPLLLIFALRIYAKKTAALNFLHSGFMQKNRYA